MAGSVAVITNVYNEDVFLPLWLRYYAEHFGREHLYVIDDGSTDGSASDLPGVNVIRLEREPIDQDNRAYNISIFVSLMLKIYDTVIFTDVDEFLVIDPLLKMSFVDYIDRHCAAHNNGLGLDVYHNHFTEPEYSPDVPLFSQRRYLRFRRTYCKPLIHKQPLLWYPGFHHSNRPLHMAPGLYLFHLRPVDYELSRRRINNRNQLAWSERSVAIGQGAQNRLSEREYLKGIFELPREKLDAALPPAEFNTFVAQLGQAIQNAADVNDQDVWSRQKYTLTIPQRFRDVIPAANSPARDADRGPSLLPPGGPRSLYDRAVQTRIEKRLGFRH